MFSHVGFQKWFQGRRRSSRMTSEVIPLDQGIDWRNRGTHIGRKDNRFYRGVLVETMSATGRWEQLMLQSASKQNAHGVILLIQTPRGFLVQAKAEPGNNTQGCVILTTTVQASFENLKSGAIPFQEHIDDPRVRFVEVPQDPGMMYQKKNLVGLLSLEHVPEVIPKTHHLAYRRDISTLAHRGLVSEFLFQALGFAGLI